MTLADLDEEGDVLFFSSSEEKTKTSDVPDVILICIVASLGFGIVLGVDW